MGKKVGTNTFPDNPWLTIPAAEYEAHMASPEVQQLQFLNRVFKETLSLFTPRSLCILGCTTGNGFEHIDFNEIKRVVAVDINYEYLRILQRRYADNREKIELICQDINESTFSSVHFDLIHCALIFEYVRPATLLKKIRKWLARNGILSVVLQQSDKHLPAITNTRYTSVKSLSSYMKLVAPQDFKKLAQKSGFTSRMEKSELLQSGKSFYVAYYS